MNGSRFASITADLLARKGEAIPSPLAKPTLDWHNPLRMNGFRPEPAPAPAPMHIAAPETPPPAGIAHSTIPMEEHHHPRRIQIGLSEEDHERLRIVAARREISRQQAVREALSEYFEKLGHDYRDECRCISGGGSCAKPCNGH